jgi:metallophosphoesterase (TIGR00282 family)
MLSVLMLGDVVGDPGLEALERGLPGLISQYQADFVVVNGENAAGGFGLSTQTLERILAAGADAVTSGNHVWEKRDFWPELERNERMLRPANYPKGTAGRGWLNLSAKGANQRSISVVNLQGREFMTPIDCPFAVFDALYEAHMAQDASLRGLILVDFHAESSREKEALGLYLDGRVSLFVGTHTHVQTADERLLPQGTAYITDLGMTGSADSILGMDAETCLRRAKNQVLYKMEAASATVSTSEATVLIQGIAARFDQDSGKALSIERINHPLK